MQLKWRRWLRILHRDFGYLAAGLTVVYSISGVVVNHREDWNPNYSVDTKTTRVNPIPDSLAGDTSLVRHVLSAIGEHRKVKNSFFPDEQTLQIFVEGCNITLDLPSGEIVMETTTARQVIRQTNFLHLNEPKKIWTWIADIFAVALAFLAISGLFMIKGKNGIRGRGAWLTGIGLLIPILFLLLYYYQVF